MKTLFSLIYFNYTFFSTCFELIHHQEIISVHAAYSIFMHILARVPGFAQDYQSRNLMYSVIF